MDKRTDIVERPRYLTLASFSLTIRENEDLLEYFDRVWSGINSLPQPADIVVLPEYNFGHNDIGPILKQIRKLQDKKQIHQLIVLGSYPRKDPQTDLVHNTAVIINGSDDIVYARKTHVLSGEATRVTGGENTTIVNFKGYRIATVICADLWDSAILRRLEPIDLILVPALTVTDKGLSAYARYQWFALGLTRSREFITPVVVADHNNTDATRRRGFEVGEATCIIDPSRKDPAIKTIYDFLALPTGKNDHVIQEVDMQKVQEYRNYRQAKGILAND